MACLVLLISGCRSTRDLSVVSGFDVNRYLGTWYEAARFPHRFDEGLSAVMANYSLNEEGTIKVINRGFHAEEKRWKQAEGVAKFRNDPAEGWLKVSFFGPFYAAYKIIYLDKDYTEAIVAGPSYDYLWILVREPDFPAKELDRLIRNAAELGFDTNRLEIIDQSLNKK